MALSLWLTTGGKLATTDEGALIRSPRCPCGAICEYCCDESLASSYLLTFSDSVEVTSDCDSYTFPDEITVTYVGRDLYGDDNCNWQSEPVDLGGGYYAWARMDYTPSDGTVTVLLAIADSATLGQEYDLCYAQWAAGTHPCDPTGAVDVGYYGASSQGECGNCGCTGCAPAGEDPGITVTVS